MRRSGKHVSLKPTGADVTKGQRAFILNIGGGDSSYPNFRSGGVNPPGAV